MCSLRLDWDLRWMEHKGARGEQLWVSRDGGMGTGE